NNIISNNTSIGATAGNATGIHIFYTDSVTVVQNNQFLSNTGGGMQVEFSEGITIKNNRFEYNATNSYGGGILEYQCSNTQIIQNEFHGNESRAGGGIFEQECTNTEITENKIIGNTASEFGGALNLYLSTNTKIINNIIAQNSGGSFGGGLVISNSTENTFFGEKFNIGVIYAAEGEDFLNESNQSGQKTSKNNIITQQNSGIEVINNTITQNTAIVGGGIYTEFSDVIVMNTILWGDTATSGLGPEIDIDGGTVDVRYSNIDSMAVFGTINSFSNNINADPLLSDSLFHLSDASLCIAAGVDSIEIGGSWYFCPPYDIYGNPRPDPPGKNPDMGACESPLGNPVGIETSPLEQLPKTYSLNQNYPNPFNPSTTVEFALPHAGFVTLKIYNILGKEVATLVSERLTAGKYEYQWDASREGGVASGVYFYRLQTESDFVQTKKLLLLK
ncbi:MAG: T9SS type A sorting domain-containing protein, partial [Gammaproteobacteria bacterium]|nr:T9SS type A sorting domain-containing protein [Gammaproteobacteria bacterium]